MPVPVYLDFVPPNDIPGLTELHIFEAIAADGPFAEIEVVTPVGQQGNYISSYTTLNANSIDNWFSVQWANADDWMTEMTEAVQGSQFSIISEIVRRVLLRAPGTNEQVAAEEAEAVVEEITGKTNPDPSVVTRKSLSGMVYLTLARTLLSRLVSQGSASSWSAGLVSMKSDSSSKAQIDDITALVVEAGRLLGISMSRVVQMIPPDIAGGLSEIVSADISRLQIEVE